MGGDKILVACIGTAFSEGVAEALEKAGQTAVDAGIGVRISPIGNKCVQPYHGLAMMRNLGIIEALRWGATHVLILDNDILLEHPTTLMELLDINKEAVIPWFDQTLLPAVYRFTEPQNLRGTGLHFLQWAVMSCVMFDLKIFTKRGVDIRLFHDHMAVAEDEYYWAYLGLFGVECWQATDTPVKMLCPPTPMWEAIKGRVEIVKEGNLVHTKFQR